MYAPSSAAAPAPPTSHGRELSATELLALELRRQRDLACALAMFAFIAGAAVIIGNPMAPHVCLLAGCPLHTPARWVPPPPPFATMPAYAPTGDDAQHRLMGARGIEVDNADVIAAMADGMLDIEIARLERNRR